MVPDTESLDQAFRALADPSRRAIVARLSRGEMSLGQLAAPLPMTLAAVGQHVKVLERGGLVRTEKVGRVRVCRLRPDALRASEAWMAEQRLVWERRLDGLVDLLADEADEAAEADEGDG